MRKIALAFVIGAIAGVPLTALLGPVGSFIAIFLVAFVISASTDDTPKKKPQPKRPKLSKGNNEQITTTTPVVNGRKPSIINKAKVRVDNAKLSKDDEELITAILPVINSKD